MQRYIYLYSVYIIIQNEVNMMVEEKPERYENKRVVPFRKCLIHETVESYKTYGLIWGIIGIIIGILIALYYIAIGVIQLGSEIYKLATVIPPWMYIIAAVALLPFGYAITKCAFRRGIVRRIISDTIIIDIPVLGICIMYVLCCISLERPIISDTLIPLVVLVFIVITLQVLDIIGGLEQRATKHQLDGLKNYMDYEHNGHTPKKQSTEDEDDISWL